MGSATDGLSRCTGGSNQRVSDGAAPAIDGLDRCAAGSTEHAQGTDRLASAISGLVRCPVGSNQHVWASTSHTECFPQQKKCSCCQQGTELLECTASIARRCSDRVSLHGWTPFVISDSPHRVGRSPSPGPEQSQSSAPETGHGRRAPAWLGRGDCEWWGSFNGMQLHLGSHADLQADALSFRRQPPRPKT